mgnify:CR=1 FL=1
MQDVANKPVPKDRLDSFADGVFGFAMTLLVVNLDLPEDFTPAGATELTDALLDLGDTFLVYVITFVVLGSFWIGRAQANAPVTASVPLVWTFLVHLFFVTLMPFSVVLIARYEFAPAIWAYGGNMIFLALTAMSIRLVSARDGGSQFRVRDGTGYLLLIASAILSAAIAAFNVDYAMAAYLINLAPFLLANGSRE